uniref:Zinc finger CCCH domain-containing protein 17 n=1 Tax=Anthurium amnicola TaxID=1678845 RepID=A0A1D1XVH8_9ARAE
MDVESTETNGNKRVFQRLGGGSAAGKVCKYWLQGSCIRHPCPYLHGDPSSHRQQQTQYDGAAPKRAQHYPRGGLVWRNPNTGGGGAGRGGPSKWGRGRGGPPGGGGGAGAATAAGPAARKGPESICKYFLKGRCTFGESCKFVHSWSIGDDFSFLTLLDGHQKVISGIALPSGSNKLYSGSADETVRIWDCESGQCIMVAKPGAEVGCIISEGPWVFIGISNAVKAVNTQTGVEMNLDGPLGQVYALVVGNDMLFAGVQDGKILAWKFSAESNCFQPVASLSGHQAAVVSLVVGAMRLYSGSMDSTIRVWDLGSLQCIQTLTDHTEVVMSLLCWDQFLLSCSLDRTIKVWVAAESGGLEVTYTHNEEQGVLVLAGMPDAHGKPVLLCSCNDNMVHLYDLPSFSERGKIFSKEEVRAIQIGPGGLFFTGDRTGELKVWKWLTNEAQS